MDRGNSLDEAFQRGIYLEEGVHYVIYGSRLKNSGSASIAGTNKTHIESISAFL